MGLSIYAAMQNALQGVASALLPRDCLLCGATAGDRLLCDECAAGLPRMPAHACPACALPTAGGTTCGACLKRQPHFDATIACFVYTFPVDKLVQQLKFAHRLAIADFFSAALLGRGLPAADLIVPVPLSPLRLRSRGFNQALEIARGLGRQSGVAVDKASCHRTLETPPQSALPWKERQKNVRGAFECSDDLSGKTVIVTDDVMTTGATLDELARVLKDHGAARVINCVAARAMKT